MAAGASLSDVGVSNRGGDEAVVVGGRRADGRELARFFPLSQRGRAAVGPFRL